MIGTTVTIYHLYPDRLNFYGDRGNIFALTRRALRHGLRPQLVPVHSDKDADFSKCDLLFMGGCGETAQNMVYQNLRSHRDELQAAVTAGMVLLAIGGSYQLLGHHYTIHEGEPLSGLGLLDLHTTAGRRFSGDLVVQCSLWNPPQTLAGFENHSGHTYLGPSLKPLGSVVAGHGNNDEDRTEGVAWRNVIGTYLHGALLPLNPWLTDWLLARALAYRGFIFRPSALNDHLEQGAHCDIVRRSRSFFYRRRAPALVLQTGNGRPGRR